MGETLLIGGNGRLGKILAERVGAEKIYRQDLDLMDEYSIRSFLFKKEYSKIIISSALTDVDECERFPDRARQINFLAAKTIAEISKEKNAHVTYISTDFVYSGNKGSPYSEVDEATPINVYGESKLSGEQAVLGESAGNLIVRVSSLFGGAKPSFPDWAKQQANKSLPTDRIVSPTYIPDLCEWMQILLSDTSKGIYNLCNANPCSLFEWGNKYGEFTPFKLKDLKDFVAARPLNSSMSTEKFEREFNFKIRGWESI